VQPQKDSGQDGKYAEWVNPENTPDVKIFDKSKAR
jgi:hypothetical protein